MAGHFLTPCNTGYGRLGWVDLAGFVKHAITTKLALTWAKKNPALWTPSGPSPPVTGANSLFLFRKYKTIWQTQVAAMVHSHIPREHEAGNGGKQLLNWSWASFGMKVPNAMLRPKTTIRILKSDESESYKSSTSSSTTKSGIAQYAFALTRHVPW